MGRGTTRASHGLTDAALQRELGVGRVTLDLAAVGSGRALAVAVDRLADPTLAVLLGLECATSNLEIRLLCFALQLGRAVLLAQRGDRRLCGALELAPQRARLLGEVQGNDLARAEALRPEAADLAGELGHR